MKVNKSGAFLASLAAIVALSVFAVVCAPDVGRAATIVAIFPGAILGIVGVTTAFIGGNVADNGVKGRFYNAALDQSASGSSANTTGQPTAIGFSPGEESAL